MDKLISTPQAYPENIEQSSEFLRMAIVILAQHKMPANPHNYQISYEYVSGKNQALIDDFSKLIKHKSVPPEEQLQFLYQRYFFQDEEFLELMRLEIRRIISFVLDELTQPDKQRHSYLKTLQNFVDFLDSESETELLLNETQEVIAHTHAMKESQQHIEQQMGHAAAEIDALRKELERVKEESKLDTLTSIANRKAFNSELDAYVQTSRDNRQIFCLLMLDIDRFKKFNDNYGHLIGDKVLRFVASILKRSIKGNDFVARFGGEEFVIILPKTLISGAMTVAEQIRKAVSMGKLTAKESQKSYGKLAISIGVTQFRLDDLADKLIQRADKALYLAKQRGRNRVEKL